MWKSIPKKSAAWISILTFLYAYGCILSPEEDPAPPDRPPVVFMDLTEREHVIVNLELSYQEKNFNEYSKLILRTDDTYNGSTYADGYYWYNQPGAVGTEESILANEDLSRTQNMFLAASGTPAKPEHPPIYGLTLELDPGSWSPVDSLFNEPCEDCWYTERGYNVFLEMGETDLQGLDNIQFYIVPVDEGGKTIYKIAVAVDVLVL